MWVVLVNIELIICNGIDNIYIFHFAHYLMLYLSFHTLPNALYVLLLFCHPNIVSQMKTIDRLHRPNIEV